MQQKCNKSATKSIFPAFSPRTDHKHFVKGIQESQDNFLTCCGAICFPVPVVSECYAVKSIDDFEVHPEKVMTVEEQLAQAIMENPDLLVLDEPMNGLDKDGVSDMREYLLDLKSQGKTILIAPHSAENIDILCDTVCEMDKGKPEKVHW